MANQGLVKNFDAGAAIAARRIVKMGAADGAVIQAAAAADIPVGVCVQPSGAASGDRVDVQMSGIAEVDCAGTITRGALVTSNATGQAVAAAPAAGTNNGVIGIAMASYVSGDVGEVLIVPQQVQG